MNKEGFLKQVAKKIFNTEKKNLHNVMVLFPNRRAVRFFFEYMKECSKEDSAFFVPEIFSIDQMVIKSMPDIQKGENLELLYLLYTVYCNVMNSHYTENTTLSLETFDDFYFFGNVILSDFDQIDKELVDAKTLFRNLQDYKNLEEDPQGYLSKDQLDLINKLFNTRLENADKSMRKNFIEIWNCLYEIYEQFNTLLNTNHLAYSGKMYRTFAKRLEEDEIVLSCEKIKVIGFSVLNNVEKKIFHLLNEKYITDFYWDYDEYYLKDIENEAGIFIRENINQFPQSKDFKYLKFDNIVTNKQTINIISSPYETTALSYINTWLDEIIICEKQLHKIAIVLNDESIIPLVLKSLSNKYNDKINITMGYPFNQTWLYNEVMEGINILIDEKKFTKENVFECIKHITQKLNQNDKTKSMWQIAILKKVCISLLKFITSIDKVNIPSLNAEIIKSVLKKDFSSLNMDILSDGINGIQLMGMLETRTLDFDYILMLSANDDNLPRINKDTSFIPFSFRQAYKMMNIDKKAGVFAYYFYRLLHNAKRIDYVYTTVGGENKLKEKSRFIRQIEIEFPSIKNSIKQINYKTLTAVKAIRPKQREYFFSIKDIKFINEQKGKLSPSSLNNLIHCQQKFYLNNIVNLKEEIEDENFLTIAFGNIFHNCINMFYNYIKHKNLTSQEIDNIIDSIVDTYITNEENIKEKRVCGDTIHLNMIKKYIKEVWMLEREEKIEYLCGEKEYSVDLEIENHIVHFKGRLDRMDYIIQKDGSKILRILDYKTGMKKEKSFICLEDLVFPPSDIIPRKDGFENIFEILFYCYLVFNNEDVTKIKPELMYLTHMNEREITISEAGSKNKEIFYYDSIANEKFEECLKELLNKFLRKEENEKYDAIMSEEKCKWCDYYLLCSMGKQDIIQ
ncbi:MAG: PD-(D/E)XK nuclease family protein [Bacteroidales bacterium]